MRNFLIGLIAGLVLATFAPRLADFARTGFEKGREYLMEFELAESAVETTGHAARP